MQRIRVRRTNTPGEVPGGALATYEPGELALNLADGTLYFGNAAGAPTPLTLPVFASPAAPTALLGLAAIPGVADTYMRSDAAPALNQAIVPSWTGLHTFTASARVSGTTASWRLNATGAAANAGNWLLRSTNSGVFTLSTATDAAPANSVYDAITVNRTGTVIDQVMLFGTDIRLDGTLMLKTGVWHRSDDAAQRFYFVPNGTTHFKSPVNTGNCHTFRNSADTDLVTISASSGTVTTVGNLNAQGGYLQLRNRNAVYDANDGYLRLQDGSYANGVYTPGRFRADNWLQTTTGLGNVALSLYMAWNDGFFTYGTAYVAGSIGGYTGLILHDGGMRCTLMSNGGSGGIYNQGDGKWLLYRASTTAAVSSYTIDAPAFNVNSARALKTITGPLSDVRATLARLRPLLYRLIDGDTREQAGFIAEEVHEVCPYLSDGKTVAYDRLAVLLLAAWQSEHGIVTDG